MNDTNSFNEELMKMLQESYDSNDGNIETCLISGETLEDNHITLECNHKFNYNHIYKEVYKQKTQPWHSEVNKVKRHQLKCPYCRNIQQGILPYREDSIKVKYVNWPPSLMMLPDQCVYEFSSGKRKGQACGKKCSGKYCSSHQRIMKKRKEKEQEKERKKALKIKKKLEKQISDSNFQNSMINIVLNTPNTKSQVITCSYKFKKGKSKGENCQCKKIHKDGLCKFHYKKHIQAIEKKKQQLEKVIPNIKTKYVKVGYIKNQNIVITI